MEMLAFPGFLASKFKIGHYSCFGSKGSCFDKKKACARPAEASARLAETFPELAPASAGSWKTSANSGKAGGRPWKASANPSDPFHDLFQGCFEPKQEPFESKQEPFEPWKGCADLWKGCAGLRKACKAPESGPFWTAPAIWRFGQERSDTAGLEVERAFHPAAAAPPPPQSGSGLPQSKRQPQTGGGGLLFNPQSAIANPQSEVPASCRVKRRGRNAALRRRRLLLLCGLVGVVGAPEFGDGARALGAFAGVGVGFDALQGRAPAQRQQGRGQHVAMQPFEPGQREHRSLSGSLRMCGGRHALDTRHEQDRKKMHAAVLVFDDDLRHLARCCEDEIGMLDSVFFAVGHADDKGQKWCRVK